MKKSLSAMLALVVLIVFTPIKTEAYTGGLLDGKPLNISVHNPPTTHEAPPTFTGYPIERQITTLTDNDEGTSHTIVYGPNNESFVWVKFTAPVDITHLRFKASGAVMLRMFGPDGSFVKNVDMSWNTDGVKFADTSYGVMYLLIYETWDLTHAVEFDVWGTGGVVDNMDTVPPAEVTNVITTTTGNSVKFNYTPPVDTDLDHLKIYRKNEGTGTWDLISAP